MRTLALGLLQPDRFMNGAIGKFEPQAGRQRGFTVHRRTSSIIAQGNRQTRFVTNQTAGQQAIVRVPELDRLQGLTLQSDHRA